MTGSAGVCEALIGALNMQAVSETVVKLGCQAIYEVCQDEAVRGMMTVCIV